MGYGGRRTNPPRIKLMTDTLYHIYVNDKCVKACLDEPDFKREMQHIRAFLELTHLDKSAKLDYVRCEAPTYTDASF